MLTSLTIQNNFLPGCISAALKNYIDRKRKVLKSNPQNYVIIMKAFNGRTEINVFQCKPRASRLKNQNQLFLKDTLYINIFKDEFIKR